MIQDLCNAFGIEAYPTQILVNGTSNPIKMVVPPTLENIENFIYDVKNPGKFLQLTLCNAEYWTCHQIMAIQIERMFNQFDFIRHSEYWFYKDNYF